MSLDSMKPLYKIIGFNLLKTRLMQRYKRSFTVLAGLTFGSAILEIFSIGALVPLLAIVLGDENINSKGIFVDSIVRIIRNFKLQDALVAVCILFLIMTILKVALKTARDVRRVILTQQALNDCQKEMFDCAMKSDLSFFVKNKSGDLVFRVTSLPREISACFTLLPSIFVETVNVIFLCILLLSVSWQLFLCVAFFGIGYGVLIRYLSKNVFEVIGKQVPEALAKQNVIANESFGGIREIIVYSKRTQWIKRFCHQCDAYFNLKTKASVLRILPGNSLELLVVLFLCGLGIFYAGVERKQLAQDLPVMAIYAMALIRIIPSIARIGQERIQVASFLPSLKLYDEVVASSGNQTEIKSGKMFAGFKDKIIFENIQFGYTSHVKVIKDLNLMIPKNKTIAIVGSSGAGKSTLMDLLLGIHVPNSGRILVDGMDLRGFDSVSWRSFIGVVPQNLFIFNASAKENIAFDFSAIDRDRVISSAKAAGAHDFIIQLKDGYETELGDRGFALSGGQRQRIAIARALYRNPEILIFDEATSALDNSTERFITQTMQDLAQNKTVIILAHRLSTIEIADLIYVVKDGRVVQSGSVAELKDQHGEFIRLYN